MRPDPPRFIRFRVLERNARLAARGFESYNAFLQSPTWKRIVREYNASDRPKRCICGSYVVEIHHLTYERVGGDELVDDLRALCTPCHRMLHVLERRDGIGLDPSVLTDPDRAAERKKALEELPPLDRHELQIALFDDLPLKTRLDRLFGLQSEDRAVISKELGQIRSQLRHAVDGTRRVSTLKLDRRVWRATIKIADRRPRVLEQLLTPREQCSA